VVSVGLNVEEILLDAGSGSLLVLGGGGGVFLSMLFAAVPFFSSAMRG
jgi:hypothetical protein